jgi:hypothetical protein
MRTALPVLAMSMLGLGIGAAAGRSQGVVGAQGERRVPIARAQLGAVEGDHGADALFSLDVEPTAVVQTAGDAREAMEFEVKLVSHAAGASSHRWVYVLTDDLGHVVTPAKKSELFRLGGRDAERSFALRTERLADGYYSLRVTAAGSDGKEGVTMDAERYLKVSRGAAQPVTFAEWSTRSRANRAIEG